MKNIIIICFYALIPWLFFSCQNDRNMEIDKDPNQNLPLPETENVLFKKSWKKWDMPNAPRLYDYYIKRSEEINGIPCKKAFSMDAKGELYGFVLAQDFMINGSLLPAGSRYEIRLGKEAQKVGYNIYLSEDCEIQGYHVRNKAGIDACIVGFYQNGSMRNFASYEDIEINSIPVRGGKNYCISLYPNGRIWMGYLSRNIEIDGQSFTEGHRVLCDTTGKVFEYSLNLQIKIMKELNIY